MIGEGEQAPDIDHPASTGQFRLRDKLESGPVVLFFYVKADTPG